MGATGWDNASGSPITLYVEVDFSQAIPEIGASTSYTSPTAWDSATWDSSSALWSSNAPVYTDITEWVLGVTTNHGFSRDTNKFNTSTGTISLDNSDGRFSPLNTSSPYMVGSYSGIGPGRPARIWVQTTSSSYSLFTGYIHAWNELYPNGGGQSLVEVSLVGIEGRIGDYTRYPQTASGAGESAASRIQRILTSAGFDRDVWTSPGDFPLQATTLEGNALDELQLVADSQGGYLWFGADGQCYFDDKTASRDRMNTFNTYEFSPTDYQGIGASFTYEEIQLANDAELVKNIVSYQRVGGTVQTLVDNSSRALYGDRAVTRTDLICTTDAAVAEIAGKDLSLLKNPEFRVEGITVNPRAQSDSTAVEYSAWESLFNALGLRTSCHVIIDHRIGKPLTSWMRREVVQSAISHNITPDTWTVGIEFSSGTVLAKMRDTQFDGFFYWDTGVWSW